jgi:subtilisin
MRTKKAKKTAQSFKFHHVIFALIPVVLVALALLVPRLQAPAEAKDQVIPDKYIVVFKDTADAEVAARDLARQNSLVVEHVYSAAIKGFSAKIPKERLQKLIGDDRIAYVAQDRIVSIAAPPARKPKATASPTPSPINTQVVPTGVARIGQASIQTGSGIGVAVLDTGIDLKHSDLSVKGGKNCFTSPSYQDGNGHGTHVAGTIAALNNSLGVVGVAPAADLYALRVLDNNGSGSWSTVICGIDWVTANAAKYNIKVANMSLSGSGTTDNNCGYSNNDPLHKAICNSVAKGVTYVVAAGNNGLDASNYVPASYTDAVITVSALVDTDGKSGGSGSGTSYGADDTFASFSNYGTTVAIGAPGVNINSTWISNTYKIISGTSMASPHAAGAAVLYLQANPTAGWKEVRAGLQNLGEPNGSGHTDPSGRHTEPVVKTSSF